MHGPVALRARNRTIVIWSRTNQRLIRNPMLRRFHKTDRFVIQPRTPKQESTAVAEPVTGSNRFQISRIATETASPIQKASMREISISKSLRRTEPRPMRTTVISTHVATTPSAEAISIYLSPLAQVGDFESSAMCNSWVEDPSYPFQAQNSLIEVAQGGKDNPAIQQAKNDGTLPVEDHNTRVIVFGDEPESVRAVADSLAKEAFHNVAYFAGTYAELTKAVN